jgi:hypothetical protein
MNSERDSDDTEQTRTQRSVVWVAGHVMELTGVGAPLVLAGTASPWWIGGSVVAAGLWAVNERRVRREIHQARHLEPGHGGTARQLPTAPPAAANASTTDRTGESA